MVWKGGEPRLWEDHMGEVMFMLRRYVRMAARDCKNFQSSKTMSPPTVRGVREAGIHVE